MQDKESTVLRAVLSCFMLHLVFKIVSDTRRAESFDGNVGSTTLREKPGTRNAVDGMILKTKHECGDKYLQVLVPHHQLQYYSDDRVHLYSLQLPKYQERMFPVFVGQF